MSGFHERIRRHRPRTRGPRYHKQKLVLLLSAMRHDALERGKRGHPVLYRYSERSYDGALEEVRKKHGVGGLEALAPAEAEVRQPLEAVSCITPHP